MIQLIPRRLAAILAASAFALALGEGVLASLCAPAMEAEECVQGEMVEPSGEEGGIVVSSAPGTDGSPEESSCCRPLDDGDPVPCPFTPLGLTGACSAASFMSSSSERLPLPHVEAHGLEPPDEARELLLSSAPFEPPRA